MDVLLVVNAGSSSLKFQSFGLDGGMHLRVRGQVDGIGTRPRFKAVDSGGATLIESTHSPEQVPDLPAAIAVTRDWLATRQGVEIRAIGHRVVHGGPDHDRPVLIDEAVLAQLARYQTLAPLHQPNNLAPIRLAMQIAPDVPQVACFDTGFHHGHADHVACYAMPRAYFEQGIRRYGFHGLSYEYIAKRLPEVVPELAQGRIIVAHLGSGASMCALQGGRSIETTMGFTALDGLPMGTRPGQLDPGVVLHLIQNEGMTASDVSDMLYHGAGLRGLSGISSDMRDLLASADPNAAFAVDHFIYRCGLQAGQLAAALGGIDGFVFTAGIGEHSPEIRARIVEGLGWLGARLDPAANAAGGPCISSSASRFPVLVIPTDEELMIAHHTLALIGGAA